MNKLSYSLIGDPHAIDGVSKGSGDIVLSGLWQWSQSFDKFGKRGDVRLLRRKEELEQYDIIHINMTSGNLALPKMVREALGDCSDTKLVVNVDFDVMQWGGNWPYPTVLTEAVDCADMIFHVESTGASVLEHVLGRKVHTLPHPVDVNGIDKYKKTDREPTITTMWHRYIPDCTIPYFAQKDIPLYRVLLGYGGKVPTLPMYDFVYKPRGFITTIETMASATFGCDLYPGRSYGRSVVEFAALAVPCVCSNTIEASRRCFPSLSIDPFDVSGANKLFAELMDDDEKHLAVFKYAYDAAKFYSQKNCHDRMVEVIEDLSDSPEKQWQRIQNRYERRSSICRPNSYINVFSALAAKFNDFVGAQGTVLDVGCGNGKFGGGTNEGAGHEYLINVNTVIGLDPLPQFETRFPVVNGVVEDIPFQDDIFDAVTIVSVLDHVIDPRVALEESSRVLKDGGKMFIWSSIFREGKQKHHLHTFTEESLTELASSMFEITRSEIHGNEPRYMFIECVNPVSRPKTESGSDVDGYSIDYWKKQATVDDHVKFWDHSDYKVKQEQQAIDIIDGCKIIVMSILDAGAGTCRMYKPARDAGYEYSAVDISDEMMSEGDVDIDTHVAKLTDLPFDDEVFDLTMCLHVIRHNDPSNYDGIVGELCRVSKWYVLILNPFVENKDDVKQMFKTEVWDMPMTISNLDVMMDKHGFNRALTEPGDGDPKKMDSFVLYRRY